MSNQPNQAIDFNALIEKNKEEISKKLLEGFVADVTRSLSWSLDAEVRKHAEAFVVKNVLPEVQKQLEAGKDELIKTLLASVKTGIDTLGEKLVEKIAGNLNSEWKISEIAKKLLG